MKISFVVLFSLFAVSNLRAQSGNLAGQSGQSTAPQDTPYAIVHNEANSRTWERTTYEQLPSGQVIPHTQRYEEVATGLNFKDPTTGEWEPSSEEIEQIPGGAVAQHGQHKIIFAADISTFGAIDMETPDGKRVQSHLAGLSYYDTSSGQSVLIAQVTNCIGQLVGTNQVWYEGAFSGLKAAVRYTYTREGFEQDVILEESPQPPEAYGLNSSSTVLQALTEFVSYPSPRLSTNSNLARSGLQMPDETLNFGAMKIGRGRAFLMGADSDGVAVSKEWLTLDGRQFLVEEIPMGEIAGQLQKLPLTQSASFKLAPNSILNVVSRKRLLPQQPLARIVKNQMRIASLPIAKSGFVLDYTSLITSQTNYTFQADTTYYLSGSVNLYGTNTTFEGATVLKYGSGVSLTVDTPVTCSAGPYRPMVMVAKDDDTVGEPISGSSGNPGTNYYAAKALYFDGTSALTNLNIQNLRILNANVGVVINGQSGHVLSDVQMLKCADGIAATNTDFSLHNALFGNVLTNFTGSTATGRVEHLTSSTANWLNNNIGTNLFLTNCLLVGITNLGSCSTQSVAVVSSSSGVFQVVGGGGYYLATNSPYRDIGTTNISTNMLAKLKQKTTYPPTVYQDISINAVTTFSPDVQRDTDTPDLGYHYEPMDYVFAGVTVNTNITFAPGTAVGWYLGSSDSFALSLANKQIATFAGTFENPDYYVRCSTVQEGGNGNWTRSWGIMGVIGTANQYLYDVTLSPELRMQFTTCSVLSWGEQMYRDNAGYLIVRATDSRLVGGNNGGYILSCFFTNCLIEGFEGGQVAGWTGNQWIMRNCTWHEGILYFQRYHTPAMPISIRDCSFDQVTVTTSGDQFITDTNYSDFDYNAYTNVSNLFPIGCAHDKKPATFNWQTGPAGNYYLPTNSILIDGGDVTAGTVGLYNFTTQTNQTEEATSTVDIGYHYIALDQYGDILDSDNDGLGDWWELLYFGTLAYNGTNLDSLGNTLLYDYQNGLVPKMILGYWRFDNTNTLVGDAGQLPLEATNLIGVPSWDTNAILVDSLNPSVLIYRDIETNGNINIMLQNGSVSFWFRPDWGSTNAGGVGPQSQGRFIELGSKGSTNGWWSLAIDSGGTNLYFGSQTNSTLSLTTNLSVGFGWTSNVWHQVVLTYSSTNSSLYVDGQPVVTNGAGVTVYPPAGVRSNGFAIGDSSSGTNQARGAFDDLETFNYPLSASDISSNYNAAAHQDRDGNGLFDIWEMNHFGHLGVDPNADPDGDGLNNFVEMEDGTDPLVYDNVRLGYWRFNDSPTWLDEQGLAPTLASGLVPVPSWSGAAVSVDSHFHGALSYPGLRTNGDRIINPSSGSVRFWFKPRWTSIPEQGDNGPQDTVRLFEVGKTSDDASYGWFALLVNSLGNRLDLVSEGGGVHTVNASAYATFGSNAWYQIAMTYTPSNCFIYVNGECLSTNGYGLTNAPATSVWQQGFNLGCTGDALHQAGGCFEELETFNYALSDADILSQYWDAMNVHAADGLPITVADGLGLRLDSVDTDCDGLPDAWELANGLNPHDPTDATTAMLALYASGGSVMSPTYTFGTQKTNIWNIAFVSDAGSSVGKSMIGAVAWGTNSANGTNDTWNFCDIHSDYMNGVSLLNASSNSTDGKLYAYLGPCNNSFIVPPTFYSPVVHATTWSESNEQGTVVTNFESLSMDSAGYLADSSNTYFLSGGVNLTGLRILDWYDQWNTDTISGDPDNYYLVTDPNSPYYLNYQRIWTDTNNNVLHYDYIAQMSLNSYLGYWYYPAIATNDCAATGLFGTTYRYGFYYDSSWETNGPFFSLSQAAQSDISGVFGECTAYARSLSTFLSSKGVTSTSVGHPPIGCAYCYLSPFATVSHLSTSLSGNDGAMWRFSGDTNHLSTNEIGGWFKTFYPEAGRTMLVGGVPSGNYQVIVYYDCNGNVPSAFINGVSPGTMKTLNGTKYWYATVSPFSFASVTNLGQGLTAPAPTTVLANEDGKGCIGISLAPTNSFNGDTDVKILGVQIVRMGDMPSVDGRPGNGKVYLDWNLNGAVTGYNVYRSAGNTNSWSLIAANGGTSIEDTNVTAGTSYYYKVTSTNGSGALISTAVTNFTPFACLAPLPPRLDFVNPLELPADNGTYTISLDCLLTNSDAYDPQGYPLSFKVESILSGSLLINGAPYSIGNCTISNGSSAVWTPPALTMPTNAASLRVYVDDGVNRSTNSVDVLIRQHPRLHVMSWGMNWAGQTGIGRVHVAPGSLNQTNYVIGVTPPNQLGDSSGYDLQFQGQNALGIVARDPRWSIILDPTNRCEPPTRMLDLDKVSSIAVWARDGSDDYPETACAVTPDKQMWVWGQQDAYLFGRPLVVVSNITVQEWDADEITHTYRAVSPYIMVVPSPVPFQDNSTHSAMTGVVSAKAGFILKDDGSLWSMGDYTYGGGKVGRYPLPPKDAAAWYDGRATAILPGRIEIDGNNASGITPGREIVEVYAGNYAGLARCKDGSIWWWGSLIDGGSDACDGTTDTFSTWSLVDQGGDPNWMPKRLTSVEIPGAAPIKQICVEGNHYAFLREDGSVQELGYIPSWDPYRVGNFGVGCGLNVVPFYSLTPVTVTNLPRNISQISVGWNFSSALTDDGNVWVWGHWNNETPSNPYKIAGLSDIVKIAAGDQFLLALDRFGRVWAVGRNETGVFGYPDLSPEGTYDPYYIYGAVFHTNAVRVAGVENATDIFVSGGYEWEWEAFAVGTEVQGKPTGLVAVGGDKKVSLSWADFTGAASYTIYRSLNRDEGYMPIGTATLNSYVDQNPALLNGQKYYYEVSAVINGVETAPSWEVFATPYPAPAPVTDLTASWACHGVKLQWQAPTNISTSPLDEYQVLANNVRIAELSADITNYYDDSAVTGSNYTYILVAYNSSGAASNSVAPGGSIPCDPAPWLATNVYSGWFSIGGGSDGNSDLVTLEWVGPTNGQWLFQGSEFDTYAGDQNTTPTETVSGFVDMLAEANPTDSPLPAWLWSGFLANGVDTNILLGADTPINARLTVLLAALNQFLTNGQSISNVSAFATAVQNGPNYWDNVGNYGNLRQATTNLFYTYPQGASLVQLKRMFLDDCFSDQFFARGGNWGSNLTGFRIHYRTLQYIDGRKVQQVLKRDISLSDLKYDHRIALADDDNNSYCGLYKYAWSIPKGAVCWASVSALVDGQESDVSRELGPIALDTSSGDWQSSLRAIPGYQQIYLDWSDEFHASGYDLYYSTNSDDTNSLAPGLGTWQPVPGAVDLQLNRFWHTNLTIGTTYYYMVVADDCFGSQVSPEFAYATLTNAPATTNYFAADASPYDGIVLVEWSVPTNQYTIPDTSLDQTNWQFFVERKSASTSDSNYQLISDTGYGLAYLDSDVTDGQSYVYRVTAFDQSFALLQAVAVVTGGTSTNITPSPTNGLTLLPPRPGNGYVDLSWSPIRATQFSILHSLNPNGPFDLVTTLNAQSAYQNAPNTYRDIGRQNGVLQYYQIVATTPTGFELTSDVKGAMPLSTLAPLPPYQFKGTITSIDSSNLVYLSWQPANGAVKYQVFLQEQTSLDPLFDVVGLSGSYAVPADTSDSAVLTFAVRAVNAQGIASDLVMTSVTNQPVATVPTTDYPVVLQIGGVVTTSMNVVGPTNLMLNAEVNLPNVTQVNFYSGGQIIGTANSAPFQYLWCHVPGGTHTVTASAVVQGVSFGSGTSATFSSAPCTLVVTVEPQLCAYQTSATDLQLPTPALPIALSRLYSSRSTNTNGVLGVGWIPCWSMGSVQLSTNLDIGWTAIEQTGFASDANYYISDTAGHYVTVTFPGGQSVHFFAKLDYDTSAEWGGYPTILDPDLDPSPQVSASFQPFEVNSGTFSTEPIWLSLANLGFGDDWSGPVIFDPATLADISYTSPDGTVYQFGKQGSDSLTWLLTKTVDRNGNWLAYTYNTDATLQSISNSCGRYVSFSYSNPQSGVTNISVTDMMGGNPALVYVVSNNFLVQVRQLDDRSGSGTYQTNFYVYGADAVNHPADYARITDVYDARGIKVLHNTYTNANGDLAIQISPGRTNTFVFDTSTYNLTIIASSSSGTNTAMATSDASGSISGVTQPVSGTNAASLPATQVSYDTQGNLISEADTNGNTKTYTYDGLNRLVGQSDQNGNSTSTELNDFGQPTVSTDANGDQTLYEYDGNGNPSNVGDPSGTSTSYGYSTPVTVGAAYLGAMQTRQSQTAPFVPYTIVTLNSYNTTGPILGDLLQMTEEWQDSNTNAVGVPVITSYQYDANGNRTKEIRLRTVNGGTQYITNIYVYDALNRVTQTIVGADGTETLASQTNFVVYNALGKQAMTVDAAGRTNASTYDFNGNLIETKGPDGSVTRTSYDGFGRQQYVQDRAIPNGSDATTAPATLSLYDASGRVTNSLRLTSVTLTKSAAVQGTDFDGIGTISAYKMVASAPGAVLFSNLTFYDVLGRLQYSVDAHGAVTENRCDAAGRRTNTLVYTQNAYSGTLPPGGAAQSTTYAYDANDNQVSVTDAAGHTTVSIYDGANRLIETRYPTDSGTVNRLTYYDGLGRKIQETDEAGVTTAYTYDFRGLLTSVTLAYGTTQAVTTVYQYDELGNEIKQTDAAGHSTTFRYDAVGRRIQRTLPAEQAESYVYDLTGNVIYQTNFNGVVITNQYDLMNRLTNRLSGSGYQVSYAYNATNGLRTNMTDASGVTAYLYDSMNRLNQKTVAWSGGPTVALNYGYDTTGLLTNLWSSTVNGVTNAYQYDILGRLTNVVAGGSSAASYGFDAVGNLQNARYGSGVTNLYQYDARNRLTNLVWKLQGSTLGSFSYIVRATGNRAALAETLNGTSRSYGWTYDLLYRLTEESIGSMGTVNYQFDAVGNRTNRTSTVSGVSNQNPSYNVNDLLASDSYDNNGNTTVSSGTPYQYDVLNHLTNANDGAVVMGYDGDGNRVKKTSGGTTTYYLLDDRNPGGYMQVVEEYQGSSLNVVYNYGLDLINQKVVEAGTIRYFGYDGHGSTRFLTDNGGSITDTYVYDAYGNKIASACTGSSIDNYLYCGEQWDADLGMYYLRARYYKPDTGRFWTMDSYAGNQSSPFSLHKYFYCQSDPINLVDPSGYLVEDVSISTAVGIKIDTLSISALATVYLSYAVYSGAKGIYDNYQINQVAQNLGVEVEPAVYLSDLQNDTDWGSDERKRDPGWKYFAHGTSIGAWGSSSTIAASGGGDFGTGFYTFKANLRGLFWAGGQATRTSTRRGGLPFIIVAKIKQEDLSGMMTTAQDLRGNSAQWTTTVSGYLNNGGQGLSGHPIVIGPVSAQGRRLNPGETPTQRIDMPDQWKWEDVSKLKPAAVIPVFNGFNQKLAW
jgi:RHS repeat-associated protein